VQSFVYIIFPFLVGCAVIVCGVVWGFGRALDSAKQRAKTKRLERRLLESNELLKEIVGQTVLDPSLRISLGEDMLDRIAVQTDAADDTLRSRRAITER
jgi:hypothetical protein